MRTTWLDARPKHGLPYQHNARPGVLMKPIRVVFIAGSGRSGSTLLGRLLASLPNTVFVGELRQIWTEYLTPPGLCGCGQRLCECPFWIRVMGEAFTSPPTEAAISVWRQLASKVARLRHVPLLFVPAFRPPPYRTLLSVYLHSVERLLHAIVRVSGCEVVIDSSKSLAHVAVLAQLPNVHVSVLHLIRDGRAVAYAAQKVKPNPADPTGYMQRESVVRVAATWSIENLAFLALRWHPNLTYRLVTYDALCRDPNGVLGEIAAWLGLRGSRVVEGSRAFMAQHHTVAGNPMRFHRGYVRVQEDLEWRSRMGTVQKVAATVITLPTTAAIRIVVCADQAARGHARYSSRVGGGGG